MKLNLILLSHTPIFEQLKLEEALLRTSEENFWILNYGSSRAIVMGSSGKKEELINLEKALIDKVPIIRRFSGGGTVIVDENTIFSSLIFSHKLLKISPFPESILKWSGEFYKEALEIPSFDLRENDYVIHDRKCTGNAQYLRKDRFLHHSSFLWDYNSSNMDYLLHPKKTPLYRENRSHCDFICKIRPWIESKEAFVEKIKKSIYKCFDVENIEILHPFPPHRSSTELLF